MTAFGGGEARDQAGSGAHLAHRLSPYFSPRAALPSIRYRLTITVAFPEIVLIISTEPDMRTRSFPGSARLVSGLFSSALFRSRDIAEWFRIIIIYYFVASRDPSELPNSVSATRRKIFRLSSRR